MKRSAGVERAKGGGARARSARGEADRVGAGDAWLSRPALLASRALLKECRKAHPNVDKMERQLKRGARWIARAARGGEARMAGGAASCVKALAIGCESARALRWAMSRGAPIRERDAKGEGFEHWAAEAGNGAALRFWSEIGGEPGRKSARGETALEKALASLGRGPDLILQLWGRAGGVELDLALARGVYRMANGAPREGEEQTFFARVVGLMCRLRPDAVRPNRELSQAWELAFPGPMQGPIGMIRAMEERSMARDEAEALGLAIGEGGLCAGSRSATAL